MPWKLCNTPQISAVTDKASLNLAAGGKKTTDLRVALDRVFVAVDGGGFCLRPVALEEVVAVGVGVLGGADVGVEGVGGEADRQLLWSHWLRCWDEKTVGGKLATGTLTIQNKKDREEEEGLTDLCCMRASRGVLGSHCVLDAVHLLLVAPAVHHGSFFGISQCSLQGLNSLSSRPKTFLQLWKLTTQICIVTNQLGGQIYIFKMY